MKENFEEENLKEKKMDISNKRKNDNNTISTYFIGFLSAILIMIIINNISAIASGNGSSTMAIDNEKHIAQKIKTINRYLGENYVDALDEKKLEEGIYKGMLYGVGDPYTTYFTSEEIKKLKETMSGRYAGIGVVVKIDPKDRLITIVNVFEGAPGEKAGILTGDKIIKVDGEDITLKPVETVIQRIKGYPGTSIKLTLLRNAEEVEMDVMRENISIPTVKHKIIDGNIGYIQIISFDDITISQFNIALKELQDKKVKSLIIDLRNNPGGVLETVISIADTILPQGMIMYTEEKDGKGDKYTSDSKSLNMPIAVLVNGNSASASEVLAGAIKAHKVGVLIGTKTFGKGVVQKIFHLEDGSALKITISKYFTPDNVCIQGIGIEPDYVVELPKEIENKPSLTEKEDTQLQKAIEVLKSKK